MKPKEEATEKQIEIKIEIRNLIKHYDSYELREVDEGSICVIRGGGGCG